MTTTRRSHRPLRIAGGLLAVLALCACASDSNGRPEVQSPVDREAMLSESAVASQEAAASQRSSMEDQMDVPSLGTNGAAEPATSPWWAPVTNVVMDTIASVASLGHFLW